LELLLLLLFEVEMYEGGLRFEGPLALLAVKWFNLEAEAPSPSTPETGWTGSTEAVDEVDSFNEDSIE